VRGRGKQTGAGAGLADPAHDLALFEAKMDAADRAGDAEMDFQVVNIEQRSHAPSKYRHIYGYNAVEPAGSNLWKSIYTRRTTRELNAGLRGQIQQGKS
jgi:hypothetical protein